MSESDNPEKLHPQDMCKCNKNPKTEWHSCPFNEEINGDNSLVCQCCAECEHECCMDI